MTFNLFGLENCAPTPFPSMKCVERSKSFSGDEANFDFPCRKFTFCLTETP